MAGERELFYSSSCVFHLIARTKFRQRLCTFHADIFLTHSLTSSLTRTQRYTISTQSVPNAPWVKRKASFRGPAVVQLSTPTHALVIHLAKASGRPSRACAPLLEGVLRDPQVVKAGCAIDQDLMELHTEWNNGLEARSRFDLGGIGGDQRAVTGLRTLCAAVLGLHLPKSRRLAMSDWSCVPLTASQLCYCARDAWVGAGLKWTTQHLFDVPFFFETYAMPGLYAAGDGPDIGGFIQFRGSIGFGYEFENGVQALIAYDHRSNAHIWETNPGLETFHLRVSFPIE